MFYIRVDANEIIATGHVMRCLAIADAMQAQKEKVIFITADEKGEELITKRGYEVLCLHSKWDALEEELDVLIETIKKHSISRLLIDSYQVTHKYLETLEAHTQVIYLDDLDAFAYPCSRVINYAVYAKECSYGKSASGKHLLGCSYMPLRPAFCGLPEKTITKTAKHLLLLSGGADRFHFTKRFLEAFLAWEMSECFVLTIICGAFHEDYELLGEMAAKKEHILLKSNVSNIEYYMQQADVAVSAGGTTLYELCACGTPAISYLLADNQQKNVESFAELGLIPYCGDVRKDEVAENVLRQILLWAENESEREKVSKEMQRLVDGKGAARLAETILSTE